MDLVDTSVWVEFLRRRGSSAIQRRLKPLIASGQTAITEWITLELMTGLRGTEKPDDLLERLAPVTRLSFPETGWDRTWRLAANLRQDGITATAADCFIATVAMVHRVRLIHCDADFEAIATHSDLRTVDWTALLRDGAEPRRLAENK